MIAHRSVDKTGWTLVALYACSYYFLIRIMCIVICSKNGCKNASHSMSLSYNVPVTLVLRAYIPSSLTMGRLVTIKEWAIWFSGLGPRIQYNFSMALDSQAWNSATILKQPPREGRCRCSQPIVPAEVLAELTRHVSEQDSRLWDYASSWLSTIWGPGHDGVRHNLSLLCFFQILNSQNPWTWRNGRIFMSQ